MTRKDFDLLAQVLRDARRYLADGTPENSRRLIAESLANALEGHVHGFKSGSFLKACKAPPRD